MQIAQRWPHEATKSYEESQSSYTCSILATWIYSYFYDIFLYGPRGVQCWWCNPTAVMSKFIHSGSQVQMKLLRHHQCCWNIVLIVEVLLILDCGRQELPMWSEREVIGILNVRSSPSLINGKHLSKIKILAIPLNSSVTVMLLAIVRIIIVSIRGSLQLRAHQKPRHPSANSGNASQVCH